MYFTIGSYNARLVSGRAAQSGFVAAYPALPDAPPVAASAVVLRRTGFIGVAGGGVQVAAREAAEGAG